MRIEVENEQVSGKKRPLELTVVNTSREMSNNVSTNATANLPIKAPRMRTDLPKSSPQLLATHNIIATSPPSTQPGPIGSTFRTNDISHGSSGELKQSSRTQNRTNKSSI